MSSQLIRKHLTFQETSEILIFKSSATVRRQVRNNPEKHFINSRHFFSWTFSTILFTFSIWRDFARSNTSLDEDFSIANVMKVNDLSLWSRVDVNYYKRGRDTARGFFCWRISSREQKYTAALSYFTGKKTFSWVLRPLRCRSWNKKVLSLSVLSESEPWSLRRPLSWPFCALGWRNPCGLLALHYGIFDVFWRAGVRNFLKSVSVSRLRLLNFWCLGEMTASFTNWS